MVDDGIRKQDGQVSCRWGPDAFALAQGKQAALATAPEAGFYMGAPTGSAYDKETIYT